MTRTYLVLVVLVAAVLAAVPAGVTAVDQSGYLVEHTVTAPNEVTGGEEFTISGDVTNRDDSTVFIEVTVDGTSVLTEAVDPGETVEFEHAMQLEDTGKQDVDVEIYVAGEHYTTETATVEVTESEDGGLLDVDLVGSITEAIFYPFKKLAEELVGLLTHLFASYPQAQPNPDVQELHRISLIVTFALSTLTVVVTGMLFQIGPVFGVSYQQARMILPRVLVALVFATVSPFLLQYAVDLAEALTLAFQPSDPGFLGTIQLTGGLVVIALLDAFLLAAVAAIFVVRDVYILFAVAASPLIALGWALPYSRRFANSFIGVFWAFLLIGPLDMIVFRLILSLLQPNGVELPHWLLAMGGFAMLLGVPYMVLSTGQAMAGALAGMVVGATSTSILNRDETGRDRDYQRRHHQDRQNERDLIRRFTETSSRRQRRNSSDSYYTSQNINRRTEPTESRDLQSNPFWNKEDDEL